MAEEGKHTCYEGSDVQSFQFYLQHSGEHDAILHSLSDVLPAEFPRIVAGKSSVDVLGIGSGGGEMDVHILGLLQSTAPAIPITADIVEGSASLTDNFRALLEKSANLQKIKFRWHLMKSEDYEKQVRAKEEKKTFDFIHMIQMVYYLDSVENTLRLYHSLLKKNGRLMIIVEAAGSGWDRLWKTFQNILCTHAIKEYRSSGEVIQSLENQALKFEEHLIPNTFDISECFDPSSKTGERLLSFMTGTEKFSESFTPENQARILDLLKNECSTEEGGRVLFNSNMSCILVHA